MLRDVKNARFHRRLSLFGWRYFLVQGQKPIGLMWRSRTFQRLQAAQAEQPVLLFRLDARTYWAFENRVLWEDEGLGSRDVLALVRERQRRADRRLERAHALLDGELPLARRRPIQREVRLAVFQRDGGCCAECGSNFDIQYDHVIPLALGGANTVENLQILCAPCNQAKGATLG